jgi:hypothetical protein
MTLSLISTLYTSLHAKSSSACNVFTSCCLVTALNNGDSSASVVTPYSLVNTPQLNSLAELNSLIAPTVLVITSRHEPIENAVLLLSRGHSFSWKVFTEPLPRNGRCLFALSCGDCIATAVHAALYLVLSIFTCEPTFVLVQNQASLIFLWYLCFRLIN